MRTAAADEQKYNLWVSTNVGQVLAIMRELQRVQGSVALCVNLQRCLDQIEGATRVALATLANADPCAFRWWLSGRVKPTLDHLCASVTNWKFLGHAIYGNPRRVPRS